MVKETVSSKALYDFERWLYDVGNKRRICYYKGFLARDRFDRFIENDAVVYVVNKPIEALASEVWAAYMTGMIHLTQQRIGPDCFSYWVDA